jgi:hypothetical protein
VTRAGQFSFALLVGWAGIVLTLRQNAEAHEKWFLAPEAYPLRAREALADPVTWLAIAGAIGLWVVAMLLWRWRGRRSIVPGPTALGGRPEARGSRVK